MIRLKPGRKTGVMDDENGEDKIDQSTRELNR